MPFALAQALILSDAVAPDALGQALLLSATRGVSLVQSLEALRTLDPQRLEQHLEKGEAPVLRHVAPVMDLVARLPPGLCERLFVVPVRQDPRTGTVDVAVVDARDPHGAEEVAYWLGAPVRTVRTSLAAMEAGLRRLEDGPGSLGMQALAPPIDSVPPPPPDAGAPGPNIPIPLTRRNASAVEIPVVALETIRIRPTASSRSGARLELESSKGLGRGPAPFGGADDLARPLLALRGAAVPAAPGGGARTLEGSGSPGLARRFTRSTGSAPRIETPGAPASPAKPEHRRHGDHGTHRRPRLWRHLDGARHDDCDHRDTSGLAPGSARALAFCPPRPAAARRRHRAPTHRHRS